MAEAVMLVCDECGKPNATTISIRAGDRNYAKDLCATHLRALLKDTRTPRRGRRRKVAAQPKTGAVRQRTSSRKRSSTKRATGRKTAAPKRRRKSTAAS
jgi:hypothetical protein